MAKFQATAKFFEKDQRKVVSPGAPIPEEAQLMDSDLEKRSVLAQLITKLSMRCGFTLDDMREDGFETLQMFELTSEGRVKNPFISDDGQPLPDEALVEKVQRGALYARPTGVKEPAQILLNKGVVSFSKVGYPEMTDPPKPKAPNFFKRFANAITRGRAFKKDFDDYKQKLDQYEKESPTARRAKAEREAAEDGFEQKEQQKYEQRQAASKKREAERVHSGKEPTHIEKSFKALENFYGPKPQSCTDFVKKNCYSEKQFAELKPMDIKGLKVGGKEISDQQFAMLGMFSSLRPEIATGTRYDPKTGMSKEDYALEMGTMWTCDLAMEEVNGMINPRARVGDYMKDVMQPGREYAMSALKEYQQGKKEELAELIAGAVETNMQKCRHKGIDVEAPLLLDAGAGMLVEMMEQDPELKNMAMDKGLSQQSLDSAKGSLKMSQLVVENSRAKKMLEAGVEMSPEERKSCIDTRLRFETVCMSIRAYETKKWKTDKQFVDGYKTLENELRNKETSLKGQIDAQPVDSMERAMLAIQLTDLSKTSATQLLNYEARNMGIPDILTDVGKEGFSAVDKVQEQLLKNTDQLNKLDGPALTEMLKPEKLFDPKSPYRVPSAISQKNPKKVQELQKETKTVEIEKNEQTAGVLGT